MKWLAPAKINLSLRVLGRRADGFHEIETLMVPLSLADDLRVTPVGDAAPESITLSCNDPTLPTDERNLAYRAAKLFGGCLEGARMPGVHIDLTKHIPHGAGLGGGSSDAATVLLAMNELSGSRFGVAQLARMAEKLGSDVPFFVYRSAAFCGGRGERVQPRGFADSLPLLLIKPVFSIPTPWAYQQWQSAREVPGVCYSPQPFAWGEFVNDLERPVYEKYLALAEMKNWLLAQQGVAGALLSGSGSTMIALLEDGGMHAQVVADNVQVLSGSSWIKFCHTVPSPAPSTNTFATAPETAI